ncbi:uncharacterized protein LOC103053704 isoform X2 [Python bivittatus]|uniref:Uncharacterized protein LOC103053704 isoform X2 n=1 Tax=Python bivittatus TaxID=176946 RepID=A0A9F5J546_PYTBI|nr:uncharacterized protein LOC103053704 isoform X2 [Python bivittatus]
MTAWERLLPPLLWAAAALCIAKDCNNRKLIVGIEGEDIVLSPLVTDNLTGISWKKGENIVADSRFTVGKENQRISFNSSSGSLFLKNLSQNDTGNYTAKVFIKEKIKETCFDLKILVPPVINCTVHNDTIQLNCTSATQDLSLYYSWDYIRPEDIYTNLSVIQLRRNSAHFQKITCYVTAFSSNASKSFNLSDCIPEGYGSFVFCSGKKKESETLNESESGTRNARENYNDEIPELPGEKRNSLNESGLELESMEKRKREGEEASMLESERSQS